MASSLHQWESDPLFSAAEVVQDSADRMESLFRILQHQQSLAHGGHPDPRLISSTEHHKRDLATILETAKWQLEDFERAVDSSAMADKSQEREDATTRHQQFISAIKEQINQVERNLGGPSIVESMRNSEWVNLNEQDRHGLALFLTGGNPTGHSSHHDTEDSSILRRFLDPNSASSLKDDEIVENGIIESDKVQMNGSMHADCCTDKDQSYPSSSDPKRLPSDAMDPLHVISHDRHDNGDCWDLEANEPKVFFHGNNKLRGLSRRTSLFGFFNNLWNMHGRGVGRKYTKRLKDGEEQMHSPSRMGGSHLIQTQHIGFILGSGCRGFHRLCSIFQVNIIHLSNRLGVRFQRFPCQLNQHSMGMILTLVAILIFFVDTSLTGEGAYFLVLANKICSKCEVYCCPELLENSHLHSTNRDVFPLCR
ncbi:hypothetical protein Tsubulata_021989 [Turnera subulata]|uniref:Syntaxin 6/10/61 N-terminal domain-containing protein n=1 Tax=Turnera subulata TaxID=218843 RepID=A0A9Q0F5J6_9ROSI|nr:hypothetical protein Tsubulata_021989 [Turnera subulata]